MKLEDGQWIFFEKPLPHSGETCICGHMNHFSLMIMLHGCFMVNSVSWE